MNRYFTFLTNLVVLVLANVNLENEVSPSERHSAAGKPLTSLHRRQYYVYSIFRGVLIDFGRGQLPEVHLVSANNSNYQPGPHWRYVVSLLLSIDDPAQCQCSSRFVSTPYIIGPKLTWLTWLEAGPC